MFEYLLLFFSAFMAATLLPLYSEVVLFTLIEKHNVLYPIIVATAGNTLGACVNWWLGKQVLRFKDKKWFYFSDIQITKGQVWFNRAGKWCLLFAWLPLVGDVFTLIAGTMRVPFGTFVVLTAIGKGARYCVVAAIAVYSLSPTI